MKSHNRKLQLTSVLPASLLLYAAVAQANSGYGVDTSLANALNPSGAFMPKERDPDGLGIQLYSRSPSGFLVQRPSVLLDPKTTAGGWQYSSSLQIGLLGVTGDKQEAKFREYKDLRRGPYLNSFELQMEKPSTARYFELQAGGQGRDDQYLGAKFGRYNSWRIQAYIKDTPHVFTSNYRSLWNGVGTNTLTLRSLPMGGTANAATTDANIGNAAAQTPYTSLSLVREKGGLRMDWRIRDKWSAYGSYTAERRKGARPFGLVSAAGGGTGPLETAESIDYFTSDILAGISYRGALQSLNLSLAASMFKNEINTLTIENPLFVTPGAGVTGITVFPRAVFDLYPDNTFYNAKLEYARTLPQLWNGQFTFLLSSSSSSQNEALIPSTPYAGIAVNGVAGGSWNTVDSLYRTTAGAKIDTQLADLGLVLHPASNLDIRAKIRMYETDNDLDYLACNPLTGQWGRLINDGSGAQFVNTAAYLAGNVRCNIAATAALGVVPSAGNFNLRSIPYEYEQTNYSLGADYRIGGSSTVSLNFGREEYDRTWRERPETTENRVSLAFVNRSARIGSLRLSLESARKRGSAYNPDPYASFYSTSLGPFPTAAATNVAPWIRTNDLHRKNDMADRDQTAVNARFNMPLGDSVDISASFVSKHNKYPDSAYGRTGNQKQQSTSLEVNWQPLSAFNMNASYSYQSSSMNQANLQPAQCVIGTTYNFLNDGAVQATPLTPAQIAAGLSIVASRAVTAANYLGLCGTVSAVSPLYPTSRTWTLEHRDRNHDINIGADYSFTKVRLYANYNYSKSRTQYAYTYNAAALGITAAQVVAAGSGFPDMRYDRRMLEASAVVPFSKKTSVRLFYRREKGHIYDWHYDGIAANATPNTNQHTLLDSGPQDYDVSIIGAFFGVNF